MTVREALAYDRALSSLKTAQLFLDRGYRQVPETDRAIRLAVEDTRDELALAIDALQERSK